MNTYDFTRQALGKVIPYGVYDLSSNQGWVSVGISHNTAEFAAETIRRWWYEMGQPLYPDATHLLAIEPDEFHGEWNCQIKPRITNDVIA